MLEVIALRPDDAYLAREAGAQRLELVRAIEVGGLTPPTALLAQMVRDSGLPVMTMIRPHARSFVYDAQDMTQVQASIQIARECGAAGIVFGSLTPARQIHSGQLEQVLDWAQGLSVTFHRAFDKTEDLLQAYQLLGRYRGRLTRVLSSGGAANAFAGRDTLAAMQRRFNGVQILVGAGVHAGNLRQLKDAIGASEYHSGGGAREQGRFQQALSVAAISAMRQQLEDGAVPA